MLDSWKQWGLQLKRFTQTCAEEQLPTRLVLGVLLLSHVLKWQRDKCQGYH